MRARPRQREDSCARSAGGSRGDPQAGTTSCSLLQKSQEKENQQELDRHLASGWKTGHLSFLDSALQLRKNTQEKENKGQNIPEFLKNSMKTEV